MTDETVSTTELAHLVVMVDGVGKKTAKRIGDEYDSVEDALDAGRDGLQEIPNVTRYNVDQLVMELSRASVMSDERIVEWHDELRDSVMGGD